MSKSTYFLSIMWVARSSRRVPKEQAAPIEEIRAAIEALTQADLLRLEGFAAWRVRGLGQRANGRTHEDLFNEAIRATLDGTRSWNKSKVDFMGYLIGAMKSISDNWGKRYSASEPILESDLVRLNEDGLPSGAFDRIPVDVPSPEEDLALQQEADAIRRLFEGDPLVTLIVCELQEGARFPEVREKYGLSSNELNAAIRRIRRRIAQLHQEAVDG